MSEREEFEEAAARLGCNLTMAEHEAGEYKYPVTQTAWDLWQEATEKAARATNADDLRKQADAVEEFAEWADPHWPKSLATGIKDDAKSRAFELRQQADEMEKDDD